MEALISLREQMSGQTATVHNKWSPGGGITNKDWVGIGRGNTVSVIRIEAYLEKGN